MYRFIRTISDTWQADAVRSVAKEAVASVVTGARDAMAAVGQAIQHLLHTACTVDTDGNRTVPAWQNTAAPSSHCELLQHLVSAAGNGKPRGICAAGRCGTQRSRFGNPATRLGHATISMLWLYLT